MTSNGQTPFTLRPWPTGDKKPQNLAEFISRVNAQPGGFRGLSETELRRDIQSKQQGRLEDDSSSSDEEDEEENDETEDAKGKTSMAAREEFLKNIDFAHQSAMLALDSISLLLSKDAPVQASTTLSPTLRELVGIGTLGASKLKEPNVTEAQTHHDLSVATGWRIMGINNMVDSVLAAAERLEKEIELETKYWADVLAVSDDGWTVCALPHEQHSLAVRFGFAESALDFKNNSIAPLVRNDDGTIKLGVGKVGGGSQRIRITIKKDGAITDQSSLPGRIPDDAPLKDRVREARNTIFHQELWYELNREARVLLAHDVYYDGPTITWKQDGGTEFIITLEDLDEQDGTGASYAEGIRSSTAAYSFLQFLLFQSHRQNYHKRTSLSPSLRQADPNNSMYNILRSLITRFEYFKHSTNLNIHLDKLIRTLRQAGITTASFTTQTSLNPPGAASSIQSRHTRTTELLWVQQLVSNLSSSHTIVITPEVRIWCYCTGFFRHFVGTYFTMKLKNLFIDNKGVAQPSNPLEAIYPPADHCTSVQEAVDYLCQASVRVLARKLALAGAEKFPEDDIQWSEGVAGVGIKSNKGQEAMIDIDVLDGEITLTLNATWQDEQVSHSRTWKWDASGASVEDDGIENVVIRLMGGDI